MSLSFTVSLKISFTVEYLESLKKYLLLGFPCPSSGNWCEGQAGVRVFQRHSGGVEEQQRQKPTLF